MLRYLRIDHNNADHYQKLIEAYRNLAQQRGMSIAGLKDVMQSEKGCLILLVDGDNLLAGAAIVERSCFADGKTLPRYNDYPENTVHVAYVGDAVAATNSPGVSMPGLQLQRHIMQQFARGELRDKAEGGRAFNILTAHVVEMNGPVLYEIVQQAKATGLKIGVRRDLVRSDPLGESIFFALTARRDLPLAPRGCDHLLMSDEEIKTMAEATLAKPRDRLRANKSSSSYRTL